MSRMLTSMRSIVAIGAAIVCTLAGGSIAAVAHTDSAPRTEAAAKSAVATPSSSAKTGHLSLVAQASQPIVDLYVTQIQVLKRLQTCDVTEYPGDCLERQLDRMGDTFDTAYKAWSNAKSASEVPWWRDQLLASVKENAALWHSFTLDTVRDDKAWDKAAEKLDRKGYELDQAFDDFIFTIETQVEHSTDGDALPITVAQVRKSLRVFLQGDDAKATTGDA